MLDAGGERHLITASIECDGAIERFAKYDVEWTDGLLESKFSRAIWSDKEAGHVKYVGDKIKFQNGFGAWQNHIYTCYLDTNTRQVLNVEVFPGRL